MDKLLIKSKFLFVTFLVYLVGCSQSDPINDTKVDNNYTGNEAVYSLLSGSIYNISGTVAFKERTDNFTDVVIELKGTTGTANLFPVHLHLGDISTDNAGIAAVLLPVTDKTGTSQTTLKYLADESPINFNELKKLNACIKIHLSASGEGRDIILAAGNIGSAVTNSNSSGRLSIGLCKSE